MSGYKRATVTISEEEYRRLHEADMKRRFSGHTKKKARKVRHTADLTGTLQQIETRQQELEQALTNLDTSVDQMEAETLQTILRQNAVCYERLSAIIEESTSTTDDSLAFISQRFSEEMQRERENYHEHLQSLSQHLETYNQKEQIKEAAARQWLRQSVVLADFIQTQFDHERFLPGRLSRILRSLDLAQANLAQGFPESTLQISQQAFLELSDLHFELEQRVIEWQTEFERTQNTIKQMISELELNSKVNALGLQGEELAEQVDLAYWTKGKYQQLLEKTRGFLVILEQDRPRISTEELRQLCTELPLRVMASLDSVIYEARLNALNSQLRMNIAETALEALESHGFQLHASGYLNEDMRAAFTANLENPDGSRVTIEVLPTEKTNQELTNELVVITNHPYLKTEHEARLQWQELCRTLSQYDLNVSRPEVHAAPPLTVADQVERPALLNEPLIRSEGHHNVR